MGGGIGAVKEGLEQWMSDQSTEEVTPALEE